MTTTFPIALYNCAITYRFSVADNLKATYEEHDLSLQNSNITIFVDEDDIFTLSGLSLFRIKDSELIKEERRENEFNLPWNKTWNLTIQLFKVCFPYEHKFAEAVQNELVSVIKWLKKVHSSDDGKSSKSSLPLPSDILINVSEFFFLHCLLLGLNYVFQISSLL